MLQYLIAQSLNGSQTHSILLCGDDTLRRGKFTKCLVDQSDILLLELMVVGEGQRTDVLGIRLQVEFHLLRRGDTRHQEHMLVGETLEPPCTFLAIEPLQTFVSMC